MTAEEGRAHYLNVDGETVFTVLHEPSHQRPLKAVLLIPPFGWEESCSYRSRRAWAVSLANDGFAVLRLDLPGSGDSGSTPHDPGRVSAWLRAIAVAAVELRRLTGCSEVAAIGLGLGGLLAGVASADGAALDELVLWAAPARGRAIVRELRAFAHLAATAQGSAIPHRNGPLLVNGFHLSTETAADLSDLDLRTRAMNGVRRALLLDRDRLDVDEELREALIASGASVDVAVGAGYASLMDEPHRSEPPLKTISVVSAWLMAGEGRNASAPPAGPADRRLRTTATVAVADAVVRERVVSLDMADGSAFAVISEPAGLPASICVVFLNAGSTRRIGPNRMWVEASRRWAALGVPTARLDLAGIGDAGGPGEFPMPESRLYEPRYGRQIRQALDALGDAGLPTRFVLVGLCSGAYWSFKIGQVDPRVASIVMFNPMALVYDPFQSTVRQSRLVGRILTTRTLRRIAKREIPPAEFIAVLGAVARRIRMAPSRFRATVAARRNARRSGGDELDLALDRLRNNRVQVSLAFSAKEPLREELARAGRLERLARRPNVDLHLLEGSIAAHTLQPVELQHRAHAFLDSALEAARGRSDSICRKPVSTPTPG